VEAVWVLPPATRRRLHHGEELEVTRSEAAAARNLMDIGGVAERLSVRVRYVRRLVAERRIPYIKLGHLLRFDPAQIDEWLERSRVDEALPTNGRGRRRAW
jgi:excisionase family DNA binding protein